MELLGKISYLPYKILHQLGFVSNVYAGRVKKEKHLMYQMVS